MRFSSAALRLQPMRLQRRKPRQTRLHARLRLSSSAAVWRRVCLRVWHVGSRSALHQPLHWGPGEMGQRQPPPLSVSSETSSWILFFFFYLNISPSLFFLFPSRAQNKNETPLVVHSSPRRLDLG